MHYIVFDIETRNTFDEVGSPNPEDLDISVVSIYNSKNQKVSSYLQEDLKDLWNELDSIDALVGYNSNHFDIPLLNKYYKKDTYKDLKQIKSIDLMQSIKESFGRRVKLDDIAAATLGKNKIAHGLEAIKWWRQGKIDQIIKYCEEDVIITHDLYLYALNNAEFKLKNLNGEVISIPLKISDWKKDENEKNTQSLF